MRRTATLLCLVVGMATLAAASPADATTMHVGAFRYLMESSSVDPGASGTHLVKCPAGTRLVGAGGGVTVGPDIRLSRMEPADWIAGDGTSGNGSLVQSWNGSASAIKMRSAAICVAGDIAADLTYVHQDKTVTTTAGLTTDNIYCASGKVLIGGGAGVNPYPADELRSSAPGTDGWQYAEVHTADPGSRTASGDAICVPTGSHTIVVKNSGPVETPAGKAKRVTVRCPGGSHVTAGGVVGFDIVSSLPIDGSDADHVPDDGWSGKSYSESTSGVPMEVYAVCVR